jgi:phospholipid/cholesterol/gamma-HCH transport system substrate-binding protein
MTQGVTGIMFIGLKASATKAPPLAPRPGEKYPVIPSEPSVLQELGDVLRQMTDDMGSISKRFQELLNEENQKSIRNSLKNLDITLQNSQSVLQDFTQQVMPSVVNTIDRFNGVLNQTEPLMQTLQENPSALVRGKTPTAPGPGE